MARRESVLFLLAIVLVLAVALPASAQSFRVQCPTSTITHPPVAGVAITGAMESGTTVTIMSTLAPHVGDIVTIAGVAPGGYNGTFYVTSVNSAAGTFTYTLTPQSFLITSATESLTGTAGTITIASPLAPAVNDIVNIAGVVPSGYNGSVTVTGVNLAAGTFTYADPVARTTALAAGMGGTATDTTAVLSNGTGGTVINDTVEPQYSAPTTYACTVANGCGGSAGNVGYLVPNNANGAIKCQQISGGDGFAVMADGTQEFMFSFGPLSGLADIAHGLPGSQYPAVFNQTYQDYQGGAITNLLLVGDPATTDGANDYATSGGYSQGGSVSGGVWTPGTFTYNGAVGLQKDIPFNSGIFDIAECAAVTPTCPSLNTVTVIVTFPVTLNMGDQVIICGTGTYPAATGPTSAAPPCGAGATPLNQYDGTFTVTLVGIPNPDFDATYAFQFNCPAPVSGISATSCLTGATGLPDVAAGGVETSAAYVASAPTIDGHVDPRQLMDIGVMNGNIPAPLAAFDEDDEFFLTLSNVGMIQRPDLFEQHTVHFHGYPNASSVYDGVPDASVAINIGGSFTYYYLAPDAGTYFWHCHITPPEHLQMGMVGQLFVRPRQNRVPASMTLYAALQTQNGQTAAQIAGTAPVDLRTVCNPSVDILCSAVTPAVSNSLPGPQPSGTNPGLVGQLCSGYGGTSATYPESPSKYGPNGTAGVVIPKYVYNDGDASTCYDVEYAIQIHGFDPNFHFVGMTFNPEAFADMKDKYFLLNGRSYPDTTTPGPLATQSVDQKSHYSQPLPSIINIPLGGRALLRVADLDVSEYQTLASLGIPMHVVGWMAKLLRDQAGNNLEYYTNSITLGGGESMDAILDASSITTPSMFYLYTPNLDHLSNDAENFGGLMTVVCVGNSGFNSSTNTCN